MFNSVNILEHIQHFLYQADAVIVPSLGTFTAHYVPSKIDEEQKKILPPAKIVRFNPHLKISDGQLANYISKAESIPVAQAERLIISYVASLNDQLNSGNILKLEQIGNLYKDSLGNIQHVFPENGNFSLETYGLPVVNLSGNKTADHSELTPPSSWSSPIPTVTPPTPQPEEEEPQKQTIAAILAENAKKTTHPPSSDHTQYTIPPSKSAIPQPLPESPKVKEEEEEEKSSNTLWGCLLPLLISGLLLLLLAQVLDPEHTLFNKLTGKKNNLAEQTLPPTPSPANNIDTATATTVTDNRPTESPENLASSSGQSKPNDQPQEPPTTQTNTAQQRQSTGSTTTTTTQTKAEEEPIPVATNVAKETQTTTTTTKKTTTKTPTTSTTSIKKAKQQTANANEYLTLDGKNAPKGHYIVVGAFGDKNNAQQVINDLKAHNFNTPYILTNTKQNGLMRTAVYVAGEQAELSNLYPEIQKIYPQAWILHIK